MPDNPSPLRYPGGKSSLLGKISNTINLNNLNLCHYAEPYAGGGGLALSLSFSGVVSKIHLNDIDRGIWAIWNAIINQTEELIKKIEKTPVNIIEWHNQKNILSNENNHNNLDVGFATFYLNRTNRSGIIRDAGPIGGFKQEGNYKIDCRFNKRKLIQKIERIKKYDNNISIHGLDAIKFLDYCNIYLPEKSLLFIDPPYFEKGSSLYTNYYGENDHIILEKHINKLKKPWILTYDNNTVIRNLYTKNKQEFFSLRYSASKKYLGQEVLIAANNMKL